MKTFNLNRLLATYGIAFFLLLATACGGDAKQDNAEKATPKVNKTEKTATDAHKGHNHSHEGHNHSHEGHNHSHEGHNHSHEGHNHGKAADTKKAGE